MTTSRILLLIGIIMCFLAALGVSLGAHFALFPMGVAFGLASRF